MSKETANQSLVKVGKVNKSSWAVDIGHKGITVARLRKTRALPSYDLKDFYFQPYAHGETEEQTSQNINEALQNLLRRSKIDLGTNVVFSVPDIAVFTRLRPLPKCSRAQLGKLVKYQIQQQIPFGIEQIVFDHCVINENKNDELNVMMAAIKNDVLEKRLKPLNCTGCRAGSVRSRAFSIYNWLKCIGQLDSPFHTIAVVDIDDVSARVICAVDGYLRFIRPIHVENFQDDCQVWQEKMANEIRRSFEYFCGQLPGKGKKIQQIFLSGESQKIEVDWLSEKLNIESSRVPELGELNVAGYTGDYLNVRGVASVLGLALSCQQIVAVDINLLSGK
jgi:Tfp pilus assembly PilM family ATPase